MNRIVLLVEDGSGDIRLTQEAFRGADDSIALNIASDGVDAMAFLGKEAVHVDAPRPHFMLLDLNLPRQDLV